MNRHKISKNNFQYSALFLHHLPCSITTSLDFIDDQVCSFLNGTEIEASNDGNIVPFGVGEFAKETDVSANSKAAVADCDGHKTESAESARTSLESAESKGPRTGMKGRVRTTLERINSTGKRLSARFSAKAFND